MNHIHYNYIDRLKGLAIILVVIGHILSFSMMGGKNPINTVITSFHMPLFMFLSGLVIKEPKIGKKLLARFLQLLAPFLVVGLLFNLCINDTFESFFANGFKKGYWYLWVLAVYYIFLVLTKINVIERFSLVKDIIIGVALFVLLKFLSREVGTSDWFSISLMSNLWLYFYTGFLVRRYNGVDWLKKRTALFSIALISYIPLLILYDKETLIHFAQIVPLTAIIILLYIFIYRNDKYSKIENLLAWIGKGTLDIYIFHYFILQIINIPILGNWFIETSNYFLEVIFLCILSIIISCACICIGRTIRLSPLLTQIVYGKINF
jgi:putative membrane protein